MLRLELGGVVTLSNEHLGVDGVVSSSVGGVPSGTVNNNGGSGHVIGSVGEDVDGSVGNVLGLAPSLGGDQRQSLLSHVSGQKSVDTLGSSNGTGGNAVGSDTQRSELDGKGVGQSVDSGLGGRHVGLEGDSVVVEGGRDEENGSLVLSELGETGLDGVVGSEQIDGDDRLEGVGRQVVEVGEEVSSGTANDKVDSAELGNSSLSSSNQRLDLSHVSVANANNLGTRSQLGHLLSGLLCNLRSSSNDGGVSTKQNHGLSLDSANGACTTGDEDDLTLEDVGLEDGLLEPFGRQCVGHFCVFVV